MQVNTFLHFCKYFFLPCCNFANCMLYCLQGGDYMTTGERIRKRRKDLGISAEKLANMLNVSPSTIYRYENVTISRPNRWPVISITLFFPASRATHPQLTVVPLRRCAVVTVVIFPQSHRHNHCARPVGVDPADWNTVSRPNRCPIKSGLLPIACLDLADRHPPGRLGHHQPNV